MFLGAFTLKIPLIDFPTTKTEILSDQSSESESSEASDNQNGKSSGMGIADNQGTYTMIEEIGNCVVMSEFPNTCEIGTLHEADNQSTHAMIEEIGNCEVMPEFPNACETGTPHEATPLSDKDVEEMLSALCCLPNARKETVNTEITTELDEDLRDVLGLDVNYFVV